MMLPLRRFWNIIIFTFFDPLGRIEEPDPKWNSADKHPWLTTRKTLTSRDRPVPGAENP
jgi:hypothetical protein